MKFKIVSSQIFETPNFDPTLDEIVIDLDRAIADPQQYVLPEFDQLAGQFFDRSGGDADLHGVFFQHFAAICEQVYFESGLWDKAEHLLEFALRPAFRWEAQHPGSFIHKGTPFYYWGMAAICRGELDKGYVLMHQALQEDIRWGNTLRPSTPAFLFATLDDQNTNQLFWIWSKRQIEFLEGFLEAYRSSRGRTLSLDEFRTRFLLNLSDLDTIFLFSYTLGRFFLLSKVPGYALQNSFVSQLEVNLLFDIILVTETIIKMRNPVHQDFFPEQAEFLASKSGLSLSKDQLKQQINPKFKMNFEPTLLALLEESFHFNDGSTATGLVADLAIAYGFRNRGAHHVSSVPLVWQRFKELQQRLFNILFLSVEALY